LQEGIWLAERAQPGTTTNHVSSARRFRGALDPLALRRALEELAARHDALRLRVTTVDGMPQLVCDATSTPRLDVVAARDADALDTLIRVAVDRPFDLTRAPLFRATLVETGPSEWALVLCAHQLVVDAESMPVLWHDLLALYDAARSANAPSLPDAPSFVSWVQAYRARVDDGQLDAQRSFWTTQLARPVPTLNWPAPDADEARITTQVALPPRVHQAMRDLEAYGVSPFVVVAAALSGVLYRFSGEVDIAIGTPWRLTPHASSGAPAVGSFVNLVVLRSTVDGTAAFSSLMADTQQVVTAAGANGDYPFTRLVEALGPLRASRRERPFHAWLSCERIDAAGARPDPFLSMDALPLDRPPTTLSEIAVHLRWSDDSATLHLDVDAGTITRDLAEPLLSYVLEFLEAGVTMPSTPIDAVPLVPRAEHERLITDFAGPQRAPAFPTIVQAIASQRSANAARDAVTQGDESLTYQALWDSAGTVARALRARGMQRGSVVGVSMARRPALLATLLGIWRAGAAFVPLDPRFPTDRLAFMATDAGCELVVADTALTWLSDTVTVVTPPILLAAGASPDGDNDLHAWQPVATDLAYLMYTSGSTGRPKGVAVSHAALENLLQSMTLEPGISANDVLLAVTTLSFDIAGLELWAPLMQGARVELATDDELLDPTALMRRMDRSGATIMQATPSTWRMLLAAHWPGRLRRILCGGEAFPSDLVEPLCARADAVWNLYGPTETTIWSTAARITPSTASVRVPIGRPIDNTRVYVMDSRARLMPRGAVGELWIAGEGVALGYHGLPDLSATRFLADPFVPGARAYRTGDLGRWTSDGELLHLGRLDNQLKVSGYRIEPGEIESVLATVPTIQQAVATVSGPSTDARLVAYVVYRAEAGRRPSASELRRLLRERLPDYMIPAMIVELPDVPLTPNGKVDRRSLPDPFATASRGVRPFEAPDTDVERTIAKVWRDVLGVAHVSRHDNFFELGGHSLVAVRAVWQLERDHAIIIDPRSMFFGSLAQLAESAR
jgi:amino acid adenylation domain-containing protein